MGSDDTRIRISTRVERELERRRRDDESFDDVLQRILSETRAGDFYDGFGSRSDEHARNVREVRAAAKEKRKRRGRRLGEKYR